MSPPMIIKEYNDLDTCGKTRVFAEVECDICNCIFKRQKRLLKGHTCSITCASIANGRTIVINCAHCGNKLLKAASKVKASKSGLVFCDRKCKEEAQKYNIAIQPDHYGTGTGIHDYRQKALLHYGVKCQKCDFNGNIKALDVHHIDKNRKNNELDNLMVLCCNCHAIEHR